MKVKILIVDEEAGYSEECDVLDLPEHMDRDLLCDKCFIELESLLSEYISRDDVNCGDKHHHKNED